MGSQPAPDMPYTELYVCFNNVNLFVNVHGDETAREADPRYLSFDFETAEMDHSWIPLITEARGAAVRTACPSLPIPGAAAG